MKNHVPTTANSCCSMEKQRLVSELRACDFCSDTIEDHNDCYQRVAKESGRNARNCLID
ncbi:MAG: hypothetical protein V2B19_10490 [Pseudomonadota bacterium]